MKILYIVPYPPDLIRVRPYQLIRGLAARGHQISLLSLWSNQQDVEALQQLKPMLEHVYAFPLSRSSSLWNCLKALPTQYPFQYAFSHQAGASEHLEKMLSLPTSYDVIHVEHLRGARYGVLAKQVLSQQARPIPVVWDSVDCISYLFEQTRRYTRSTFGKFASWLDLPRTRRFESHLPSRFDQVLVTSALDRDELIKLAQTSQTTNPVKSQPSTPQEQKIRVLPNGVDLEYFSFSSDSRETDTILFSGKMSYHANITAARYLVEQVMPIIWSQKPLVKLIIAGKSPPTEIKKMEQLFPDRVFVTGSVPDMRPYFARASVAVVPLLYGAGIQNKVLEAMACGTPVVCTRKAVAALGIQPGIDALVADTAAEIAAHILNLLADPARCESIALSARSYVEKNHDWREISARLENIYANLVNHSAVELSRIYP